MKLIKDWPQAYKWWSVHAAFVTSIVSCAYALTPTFQAILSPTWYAILMCVLGLAIIGLRVLQQGSQTTG